MQRPGVRLGVQIFNASWTYTWTDPNDPFQTQYTYTYNGLWPSEGIPCPQGRLRGYLSH